MTKSENKQQAWKNFIATGRIEYYLKSVDAEAQCKIDKTTITNSYYKSKKSLRSIYEAEC